MPNWRAPNIGPLIHGLAVWLITDGLPVLQYLQDKLAGDTANFDWNRFLIGLAAAIVTALISAGRNAGAVTLPTAAGARVKAAMGGDKVGAVVVPAREVEPNDEAVVVLRGQKIGPPDRPTVSPDTSPPSVTPPPTADRPYDSATPGHEWGSSRETHRTPLADRLSDRDRPKSP